MAVTGGKAHQCKLLGPKAGFEKGTNGGTQPQSLRPGPEREREREPKPKQGCGVLACLWWLLQLLLIGDSGRGV